MLCVNNNATITTTRGSIIFAALFAISASLEAQTTDGGNQSSGVSVVQLVAAQCPKFTSEIVDRPELKPILSQRPVDIGAVVRVRKDRSSRTLAFRKP